MKTLTDKEVKILQTLVSACEAEFCCEETETLEPNDSKVSFPEEDCHITFGMIREARRVLGVSNGHH